MVLEDTSTTGGSVLTAVRALREAGHGPEAVRRMAGFAEEGI